jgi:hypothetical protein
MTSLRRSALLFAVVTPAVGGGATAWLPGAGASTVPTAKSAPPGAQPNGVNFTIHTALDPNFCVEDTPSVGNPASEATMSQCIVRDNQHWTFANADDGSVVIIGGNGDCLTFGAAKLPNYVSVLPCTFKGSERFYYTPVGQIESTSGKKCLQPAQAAQNASIDIVKCDATNRDQVWQLGH